MNAANIEIRLQSLGDKDKAKVLQGFFKTGEGQYGGGDVFSGGDVFIGINVPTLRKLWKE